MEHTIYFADIFLEMVANLVHIHTRAIGEYEITTVFFGIVIDIRATFGYIIRGRSENIRYIIFFVKINCIDKRVHFVVVVYNSLFNIIRKEFKPIFHRVVVQIHKRIFDRIKHQIYFAYLPNDTFFIWVEVDEHKACTIRKEWYPFRVIELIF